MSADAAWLWLKRKLPKAKGPLRDRVIYVQYLGALAHSKPARLTKGTMGEIFRTKKVETTARFLDHKRLLHLLRSAYGHYEDFVVQAFGVGTPFNRKCDLVTTRYKNTSVLPVPLTSDYRGAYLPRCQTT